MRSSGGPRSAPSWSSSHSPCRRRAKLPREILDQALGGLAHRLDLGAERLVARALEVFEREVLELVLELAHAEAVRDGRVDVARLLRNPRAPLLGLVLQRPHVVEPVGELDEDDANVVDNRHEHLAEALGLPLLARRELQAGQLRDALDDVGDALAEELADLFDRVRRVLDDVVQKARGDRDDIQPQIGEDHRDAQRMDEVRLARSARLALMLEGRELVGAAEQLDVGVRVECPDLVSEILEPDHGSRCQNMTKAGDLGPAGRAAPYVHDTGTGEDR